MNFSKWTVLFENKLCLKLQNLYGKMPYTDLLFQSINQAKISFALENL